MADYSNNQLKIKNLITAVNQVQNTFQQLTSAQLSNKPQVRASSMENKLQTYIYNTVLTVEDILQRNKKNPAHLPIRSRRAYQWLKFLVDQKNFTTHRKSLMQINQAGRNLSNESFEIQFYHFSPIYKVEKNTRILLVAQESFITAPEEVFITLLRTAFHGPTNHDRLIIRDYTTTREYCQIRERLEYLMIPRGAFAVGKFWNLETVFSRVNQNYFKGQISRPHLMWSSRPTRRKYGHYQQDTRTVMISSSLDRPQTPPEVLDYVMYHELLHISLGATKTNQRRYVHTAEFKKRERAFTDLELAKAYLNKLSFKQ